MTADVDVVIPVRNGGRLLRRALDSVLEQDGVGVRVFVVDDHSTDSAVRRLPRDRRLVVMASSGSGIPAALNTGINAGSAPYIARQDADDESLPGRLKAELSFLDSSPGIGLVGTGFEIVVGDRVVMTVVPGSERSDGTKPALHRNYGRAALGSRICWRVSIGVPVRRGLRLLDPLYSNRRNRSSAHRRLPVPAQRWHVDDYQNR